jgi:LPXTG-site transpeptidase (sortase) family protein
MDAQQSHVSYDVLTPKRPPFPVFLATTMVIFFSSLSAADSVGFVPYYVDGTLPASARENPVQQLALADLPMLGQPIMMESVPVAEAALAPSPQPVLPERLSIDAIGLDLPIHNVDSRDLGVLDIALEKGPVRYVDSALLNVPGNMLIFAHSSHLPVVRNQMFKAFNRLPELTPGDTIVVEGGGKKYLYSVVVVRRADAAEEVIDLSADAGTRLTLSTCDTLTSKSSRFVVEAEFVGVI